MDKYLVRKQLLKNSNVVQIFFSLQTEDYLKRKIRSRPERSELIRMHILEGKCYTVPLMFFWSLGQFDK